MRESAAENVRGIACVLLRKSMQELWSKVDAGAQEGVKQQLLQSIQLEPVSHVRNKVSDTCAQAALIIFSEEQKSAPLSTCLTPSPCVLRIVFPCSTDVPPLPPGAAPGWPDLLPFLLQCAQSEQAPHRESALNIFAQLGMFLGSALLPHIESLKAIFAQTLSDAGSGGVRIAALKACSSFLPSVEDAAQRAQFSELVGPMVQVISTALSSGEEDHARQGVEVLIEMIETDMSFLRPSIQPIVELMVTVCKTEALEDNTRQMSMEFLLALAEKSPPLVRKMGTFVSEVLPIALSFMLSIEYDEEWEKNDNETEDSEFTNYDVGEEGLDRLAMCVGGKAVLPVAFSILPQFFQNQNWQYRHAGLMAVSQIGEGCEKQMREQLGEVISMVLQNFHDPHPRVRWAAINTIGQMATDFGPDLQLTYHREVLSALLGTMSDQSARVQSHSAAAIINFCEHATSTLMAPYLDSILQQLLVMLQNPSPRKIVLEQAITAVASVADSAEDKFAPYYPQFMPYLKDVLRQTTGNKEYRMLRGKAMECISLIGLAVGKETFQEDAKEVMQVLVSADGQLDPDDPQISYMMQAWTRICKALGPDFVPYLPYVMPMLLKSAELQPDVTVVDADDVDELEGMETVAVGDKRIGIRTSVLEEKATACNMMACFVSELQAGFYPYIEQTAKIMIPLLQFYYHDEVRSAAVSCMPELIKCVIQYCQQSGTTDPTMVVQLSNVIYDKMIESLVREPEPDIQVQMIEGIGETILVASEFAPNCIGAAKLPALLAAIPELWKEIQQRGEERQEQVKGPDFDEEEWEVMQAEAQGDTELQDAIVQSLGACLKTFKGDFLTMLQTQMQGLIDTYLGMLAAEDDTLRRVALCFFCDVAEHCGESSLTLAQRFLPSMLAYASPAMGCDVRQAAVYGLGACAQGCGPQFAAAVPEAMAKLTAIVSDPKARSNSNEEAATDNAISAIGKMCLHQSAAFDVGSVLPAWVGYLPVKADIEEAPVVNKQLCQLLQTHQALVLGASNERLPKVVEIMADALETNKAPPEVAAVMRAFISQLKASAPETLQGCLAQLSPELQEKMAALLPSL